MFRYLNVFCFAAGCLGQFASAQSPDLELLSAQQQAVRAAVAATTDTVVQIETLGGLEKVGDVLIGTAPTTGVIVSADGHIVSSAFNFLQQPASLLVTLANGQRRPATLVARDRSRMLVLLKIDADGSLPVPTPAPRDSLRIGQTVVALGKTFDPARANLSVGILSAVNRIWGKAVQTDAKISPANYGGPLIDLEGRVLGILVPLSPESETEVAGADLYDSGIGFAVPLVDIMRHLDQWTRGDDLRGGKLGIAIKDQEQLDPEPVVGVVKLKSPAAAAGLKLGDRIVSINGQATERHSQLRHALMPLYSGDEVELTVRRGDEDLSFRMQLVAEIPAYEHPFLGILPERRAPEDAAVVRFVFPESPAFRLGLQPADRITACNDQPVATLADLRLALANREPDQGTKFSWVRAGVTLTGDTHLSRLPEQIVTELPAIHSEIAAGTMATGEVKIQIPEEPNECTAYVPETLNQGHQGGLLIVLGPPGKIVTPEIIAQWKVACDRHDLVLLVPQPAVAERWQSSDVAYLRKLVDHVRGRFDLDGHRVGLVGNGAGGVLAYMTGFRHRDVIRAIAIADASLPQGMPEWENDPLNRLALLLMLDGQSKADEQMREELIRFRSWKFPVSEIKLDESSHELSDSQRNEIGRWIDGLDRL